MEFSVPGHIVELRRELRLFLDERVTPVEAALERQPFADLLPRLEEIRAAARDRGWWLPHLPRQQGGMGLSLLEFGLISEELGRNTLGHFVLNCQAPDAGNMEILIANADDSQRDLFLRPLLSGRERSCFAMTEPEHAGSNPVWMGTTATRDDADYVLRGHKWFASSADGASFCVVMAVTDADAEPHRRATLFIVPTEAEGFRLVRNIPCMGHVGDSWLSHSEIRFEDCRIPARFRLGAEGEGFTIAQQRLGFGRIHHCMRWIGICERAFDLMCDRAIKRKLAPGQSLADRQTVRDWIATSRMEIDSARLAVLHAAWKIETVGLRKSRTEISCIKFQVAGVLQRVLDRAIQTHGALGTSDDTPLAFLYRHERAARIYDGPDEVHKMAVAKQVLKSKNEKLRKS